MKMNFSIFVGMLVLLAGASILLDAIFGVHLPLVRSAVALFLIFAGVRLLVGAWGPRANDESHLGSALMTDMRFAPTASADRLKYDVIFGRGTIDLTGMPRPQKPMQVEVNAIFSTAELTIDPSWPVAIEGNSAFGEVRLPGDSRAGFGSAHYRSDTAGTPLVTIKVNAVFGSAQVVAPGRAVPPLSGGVAPGASH